MAHILILEPDKLTANTMRLYFGKTPHTAAIHSSPQQAVTSADHQRPQVIVTELQLAGRTGVEFLYEVRSYPDWQDIPLIIFSGLSPEQLKPYSQAFSQLNIAGILHKGQAGLNDLLNEVDRLLVYETV